MASPAAGIRVGAFSRRRDFRTSCQAISRRWRARRTPALIEGAGTPCSTHVTDEQTEGAACADAIGITDIKPRVAKDFMCASARGPDLSAPNSLNTLYARLFEKVTQKTKAKAANGIFTCLAP